MHNSTFCNIFSVYSIKITMFMESIHMRVLVLSTVHMLTHWILTTTCKVDLIITSTESTCKPRHWKIMLPRSYTQLMEELRQSDPRVHNLKHSTSLMFCLYYNSTCNWCINIQIYISYVCVYHSFTNSNVSSKKLRSPFWTTEKRLLAENSGKMTKQIKLATLLFQKLICLS